MIDWPIAELLPHAGNMILLDGVYSFVGIVLSGLLLWKDKIDMAYLHEILSLRPGG